jgi:exopolyphosphatase/guanosine-5'-triphosphate,3'-diphosphate pyrophosphatase
MRRLGIIDLGSNTARFVVYGYQPGLWFRLLDDVGETVRLGEGLARDNTLTEAGIARAVATIELFSDYAASIGLSDLEVIGTSALRDATNGHIFLDRTARLNLPIRILTGEEEASYGVSAVANGFTEHDAWVLDIGGGSAQLSRMSERRFADGHAYPLGAVRLTEAHLHHDPPLAAEIAALEAAVERQLGTLVHALERHPDPGKLALIAMGGSVRNLARATQRRENYPLPLVHGYRLRRAALEALTAELLTQNSAARAATPGLKPDRADIILAPALVYRWLLRHGPWEEILISGHGLREGALYRHFLAPPYLLEDVRRFTVNNLFSHYEQPPVHTRQVRHLARRLFDELAPLHGLGDEAAQLLDAAAVLHDIGSSVSFYRHHHHGAYLVTAAALPGFSHREQALLARLVRFHNKGTPRVGIYAPITEPGDEALLANLSVCLRLAESLERSRAGRVKDVRVALPDGRVEITLVADSLPTVEMWEAGKQADVVRQAFGRELRILAPA